MRRSDLVTDCARCAALCCKATSFEPSEDFAIDKPAGVACPYLRADDRCRIHAQLAARGFSGCAVYECYGAGQRVTRMFSHRADAEETRNEAFLVLRVVHELLFLLTEAAKLCPATEPDLRALLGGEIAALDAIGVEALRELDVGDLRARAQALLRRVGTAVGGRSRLESRPSQDPTDQAPSIRLANAST